mmetsp:Transcript_11684/g.15249  ORF Transcript_11684/g.15249 Transcript_11684/m.15249 type:complete len:347 (+) Transcript_11684:244-1284(+)|eukprot:CAMPEP_0116057434 /NCGR_PEP_ID=MMETSP0322-20121206/4605_1 /TAXON_ID=163516 /ORGANISM="Leptocylindrus danicus var. apora, Strain B651" /LENGTH=346 /DNA_ID=CAMNT_0003541437 /DNA_START=168 /DNA_END=1208 /DNA_ORIENTATION=+
MPVRVRVIPTLALRKRPDRSSTPLVRSRRLLDSSRNNSTRKSPNANKKEGKKSKEEASDVEVDNAEVERIEKSISSKVKSVVETIESSADAIDEKKLQSQLNFFRESVKKNVKKNFETAFPMSERWKDFQKFKDSETDLVMDRTWWTWNLAMACVPALLLAAFCEYKRPEAERELAKAKLYGMKNNDRSNIDERVGQRIMQGLIEEKTRSDTESDDIQKIFTSKVVSIFRYIKTFLNNELPVPQKPNENEKLDEEEKPLSFTQTEIISGNNTAAYSRIKENDCLPYQESSESSSTKPPILQSKEISTGEQDLATSSELRADHIDILRLLFESVRITPHPSEKNYRK